MTKENLLKTYYLMQKIRITEEAIASRYHEQKMRCPTHLSIGQELPPAVAGTLLNNSDYAVSTHRSHAHYIGKGGSIDRMIAEIYGKKTGCAHGRGGSMHLIDTSVGFMGSTAIVGNSIPVGVGFGLSFQIRKSDQISVIYLGDGAIEEGVFFESANFAALKKIPVLFVCENNLYSVYSHINSRQPSNRKIFKFVESIGIKSSQGDGNNLVETNNLLSSAIKYVRGGNGPAFVELDTYRWREHCGPNYDNNIGYRSEEEFLTWKKRDPIPFAVNYLLESGISKNTITEIDSRVLKEVDEAFGFAERSEFPEPSSAFTQLFKEK